MLAAVCVGLAWSAAAESAAFRNADSPPSIVVLLSDDAGWADPGWSIPSRAPGHDIRTPNLDALAAESLILDACYVTASVCSPSRAGLLT